MPLQPGRSAKIKSHNISEMIAAGHPRSQAIAASLHEADKAHNHLSSGGFSSPSTPFYVRNEARNVADDSFHGAGLFGGDVAGRTDRLPRSVPADSFVFPADSISSLGQGNTLAGAKLMNAILASPGPYGVGAPRTRHADGGETPGISRVMVASGELLANPTQLKNQGWKLRKHGLSKAKSDLAAGHEWARGFVEKLRKHQMKFLKSAPKPKK